MPSLHTVGATPGCSFQMHFHLDTNPHQRLPEIIEEPFFSWMKEFGNIILYLKVMEDRDQNHILFNFYTVVLGRPLNTVMYI